MDYNWHLFISGVCICVERKKKHLEFPYMMAVMTSRFCNKDL